ncbi:hypothetical protein ONZ45_g17931 [Pleurotus djamor]|nr:hypothetical protein ONZ45_g17931 [Pleurotus djamor]
MPPSSSSSGMPRKFIGAVEDEWQLYSDNASDYSLGSIIGFGASSTVYTALYNPPPTPDGQKPEPIPCALKVLDLDSLAPRSLSLLQRETILMSLSKHPNVIRVRGSWIDGHKLYIAMRLMNKGSAADVMRYGWPGGMEEEVIKCILKQTLQGLNYLHVNGFIHRDVKAANLLIDDDGTVLLGDLGVAADLAEDSTPHSTATGASRRTTASAALAGKSAFALQEQASTGSGRRVMLKDSSTHQRPKIGKRKSFVGTPCWMAPELIQGRQYDASADIWSFGITALELTQGRPPRSRESSQKVLLSIIQEDPPVLNRDGGVHKYSRAFNEIISSCLVKDPTQRPTAAQLLQSPFFKSAKKPSYLVNAILKNLPPLSQRQERLPVSSALSHRTIESWDFATTIHTPNASIYRRRPSEDKDYFARTTSGDDVSASDFSWHGSHTSLPGKRHAKGVSWHEDPPVLDEEEDLGGIDDPLDASARSSPDRIFADDQEVQTDASTSPSSISLLEKPLPTSQSKQPSPSLVTNPLPSQPPAPPAEVQPQPPLTQSELPPSSTSSSGIWRKLKTNLRRPSSSRGLDSTIDKEKDLCKVESRRSEILKEFIPEKDKGSLSGRFARKASASRNALAGATNKAVEFMKS